MSNSKSLYFDVVFASDIFVLGGTNAVLASYADFFFERGIKVAILPMHLPHATEIQPVYAKIRDRINSGKIFVIQNHGQVDCNLFIIDNPSLLHTAGPKPKIKINARRRVIIVPFPPKDGRGLTYDPLYVLNSASAISQGSYTWAPVSPLVRKQFETLYPYLPLTASDIRPVLDRKNYRQRTKEWSSRHIVAGRHSRPHAEKWPKGRSNFLRVYPAASNVEIRFLGIRPDQLHLLIGNIPENYRLYGYNEIGVADFLSELDFFVYFNTPWWIEALGIVILEAMLSKVPCVLPNYMKANFGDHAIYCGASNVWDTVRARLRQRGSLPALVDGAYKFVSQNYSKRAFASWLDEIGFTHQTPARSDRQRLDACYLLDLRKNSVLLTSILEKIAYGLEEGEKSAIVVSEVSEFCAYARAFVRDRNIPLRQASPNSKVVATKLHIFDLFDLKPASALQYIEAGEIEIHLSKPPKRFRPEIFNLLAAQNRSKFQTTNKSAQIWVESHNINYEILDQKKPVLTGRTVEIFLRNTKASKNYIGIFCEGVRNKIQKRLNLFPKNISVYDVKNNKNIMPNIVHWVSKLSTLYIIAHQGEIHHTHQFVMTIAQRLGVPFQLIDFTSWKTFARAIKATRNRVDA